jgi:hypothetical protein
MRIEESNFEMYVKYDHLGTHYPYYIIDNSDLYGYSRFEDAFSDLTIEPEIDPVAIIEVLSKNYMLGDRTLIKGIFRSPWMAKPCENDVTWKYCDLPVHGLNKRPVGKIAEELYLLLRDEVCSYVKNYKNIGLLLSGGMDSRIVAGVLYDLICEEEVTIESVTALTWGEPGSRDVVYAELIAKLFNWRWKHYRIGTEDLWDNFRIAGERGCEYTGFHLHAIPQIASETNIDMMLAGSYGDSIGRGEYSGRHLTKLKPITDGINSRNSAFLIKEDVFREFSKLCNQDVSRYHELFPREKVYQQNELDYQLHYMRRMLNPCLEVLNEVTPVRQVFTSPQVFSYMWSIHPRVRNDEIYKYLLQKLPEKLRKIPWARNGLSFGAKIGEGDLYTKKHHKYPELVQQDLINQIEQRLLNHVGFRESIFNMDSMNQIIKLIKKKPGYNFDFLEKLSWLLSFTYFQDRFDLNMEGTVRNTLKDYLNGNIMLPLNYSLLHAARSFRDKSW